MPQPPEFTALPNPLIDLYRAAWERVVHEQQRIIDDPLRFRRYARLQEIRKSIEREMDALTTPTRNWIRLQFPHAYSTGVATALSATGETLAGWTTIHREAVQELANGMHDALLGATRFVKDDTKRLIRAVIKDESLQKAIEGRTAVQAARVAAQRIVDEEGIAAVVYANGARHGLADYSEMAMRTQTAIAYNRGTLNGAQDVAFFEIFDGFGCGLTFHDDPTVANGMIVDRATAEAFPIAHPRCQRSLGPRPDITDAAQAKRTGPTPTEAQRADQMRSEVARQLAMDRRAAIRQSRSRRQTGAQRLAGTKAARQAKIAQPIAQSAKVTDSIDTPRPTGSAPFDVVNEKKFGRINSGLDSINEVHDVPAGLPDTTIYPKAHPKAPTADGAFDPADLGIYVKSTSTKQEFVTAHEVGHYLDWTAAPTNTFLSNFTDAAGRAKGLAAGVDTEVLDAAQAWMDAVRASDAFKGLFKRYSGSYLDYARSREELWARSYSQFIAKRSTNAAMRSQLDEIVAGTDPGLDKTLQWADTDFAPVEDAIENLMRKLGWLKSKS